MKQLAVAIVVLCLLTSCATQEQTARTQGTAGGAVIGAGLGAVLGYAIGGAQGAAIGAGIGGVGGAAVGYSYADRVAKRHKELADRENDLDARIKFARGVNEDTEEQNRRLEEDLQNSEAKIEELKAKGENLAKEKQLLAKRSEDANRQLAHAEQELQGLKTWRTQQPQKSTELDAEINKLEKIVAQLRTNTSALASMNQRM